ncbi:protein ANTAGONIST OF LIKE HETEROCHROMATIN PROTEIN 1-like [Spodoptera litura]|uniref:Protein ANTAGONIST OF LIKE HETEROCHROMATIN PROTEIN 1-like n=1 Tax=Spodoptera litura TaxID=69820 RepID=A0A9J7J4P7_SPOLT|nr:protein ANTAGONIST OF LIKE HETEROCHROMATIN PROTEIN 1-like [Spodoptera litura]
MFRAPVQPIERLAVTLRYFVTGETFKDLHFSYRLGASTIGEIIKEVCKKIWTLLHEECLSIPNSQEGYKEYMKMPSKEDWLHIASKFQESSNFPLCLGAVDGKHIRLIKPIDSDSMFLNYKHFFSIVLMAVVDSDYNFIFVDVGAYGKECDSSVFKETPFWKNLTNNGLNLPDATRLPGIDYDLPYVFVADEAFALHYHLLRPFGGHQLDQLKRTFNYRLTRARRFVECAFGILSNKWRIFHRPMNVSIDLTVDIVKTCCVLQNFIHKQENFQFHNASENESTLDSESELIQLPITNAVRGSLAANEVRNRFAQYFVSNTNLQTFFFSFGNRDPANFKRFAF